MSTLEHQNERSPQEALGELVLSIANSKLAALGLATLPEDNFIVCEVKQAIENYCNVSNVPYELRFVWANMVVDFELWESSMKKSLSPDGEDSGSSTTPTIVSSIKEGTTTIGFSADTNGVAYHSVNAHSLKGAIDGIVFNYKDALNRFRKVVW